MFNLARTQLLRDWKTMAAIFTALIATGIFVSTFFDLGATAIHESILGADSLLKDPKEPMIIFNTINGMVIAVATTVLAVLVTQAVKRRKKWLTKIRIIGVTYGQMQRLILLENSIMLICGFAIGVPCSLFLIDLVQDLMINNHALETGFKSEKNWLFFLIGFAFSWAIVLVISLIAVLEFKHINLNFKPEGRIKVFAKLGLGITFLGGGIAILMIKKILQGGLGTGMIISALILFLLSLTFLIKYPYDWLMKGFAHLCRKRSLSFMAFKSLRFHRATITLPIIMATATIALVVYAADIPSIMSEGTARQNLKVYENIQSGISLNATEPISNYDQIYQQYAKPGKNINITSETSNDLEIEDSEFSIADKVIAVGGNKFLLNYQLVAGDFANFLGQNRQPQTIAVAKNTDFQIDQIVSMRFQSHDPFIPYRVAAIYEMPIRFAIFPDIIFNLDDLKTQSFSASKTMRLATVLSDDPYLKTDFPSMPSYDVWQIYNLRGESNAAIAMMFAIIFSTYMIITFINTLGIYIVDKKPQMRLARVLGLTMGQTLRILAIEYGVIATLSLFVGYGIALVLNASFASANLIPTLVLTLNPLILILIGAIVLFCLALAIIIPMLFMNNELKYLRSKG